MYEAFTEFVARLRAQEREASRASDTPVADTLRECADDLEKIILECDTPRAGVVQGYIEQAKKFSIVFEMGWRAAGKETDTREYQIAVIVAWSRHCSEVLHT